MCSCWCSEQWATVLLLCDFTPHHCAVVKSASQWRHTFSCFSFHKVRGWLPWQQWPVSPAYPQFCLWGQGRKTKYPKNCFWMFLKVYWCIFITIGVFIAAVMSTAFITCLIISSGVIHSDILISSQIIRWPCVTLMLYQQTSLTGCWKSACFVYSN